MVTPVLIVGAGPAGLAVAACLRRRWVSALVVERDAAVGQRWRTRYDRLRLHTPRVQSQLPGLPIPRRFGRWVARDDLARYLAGYARYHGIVPRFGVEVERLDRAGDGWRASTSDGDIHALQVVLATGYSNVPYVPDWPGLEGFTGEFLHGSQYRSPEPYRGRDVLVVGTGNTGAEIAADVAGSGARRVWLAVRTPPNIVPRTLGGVPTTLLGVVQDYLPATLTDPVNRALQRAFVGDLEPHGLPRPREGVVAQFRATGVVPIIDVGLVEQLRAGRVEPVAAVAGFEGDEVLLAGGVRVRPDAVIAATGYSTGLEPMVGHLGVLDAAGRPLVRGAASHPAAPGLRFAGVTNPLKGLLLQINLDARATGRAVAGDLLAARGRREGVPRLRRSKAGW